MQEDYIKDFSVRICFWGLFNIFYIMKNAFFTYFFYIECIYKWATYRADCGVIYKSNTIQEITVLVAMYTIQEITVAQSELESLDKCQKQVYR